MTMEGEKISKEYEIRYLNKECDLVLIVSTDDFLVECITELHKNGYTIIKIELR